MDKLTPGHRSWLMSRVRAKNTSVETLVRKAAHALGFRFRIHRTDLPGTPDLVFPRYRLALFVHGCFWHRHPNCKKAGLPKSKFDYWQKKFDRNVERDHQVAILLRQGGWRVAVIWECETKDAGQLNRRLKEILLE
jgi:DNA mismatch endonuclease, patch repair protein